MSIDPEVTTETAPELEPTAESDQATDTDGYGRGLDPAREPLDEQPVSEEEQAEPEPEQEPEGAGVTTPVTEFSDSMNSRVLRAAIAAHEVNRAYCAAALGDHSHAPWDDAPEYQQNSIIRGVEAIIDNPDLTPAESHEGWFAQKVADGWSYGPVKDAEAKTHPCMVPYSKLSADQRVKDTLFGAVVRAVLFD